MSSPRPPGPKGRWKRRWLRRFEAWNPTLRELKEDPVRHMERTGRAGYFKPHVFERIVSLVHRYDTSLTNQMMRLMHELERVQRRRKGEPIEPPVSADVNVTGS